MSSNGTVPGDDWLRQLPPSKAVHLDALRWSEWLRYKRLAGNDGVPAGPSQWHSEHEDPAAAAARHGAEWVAQCVSSRHAEYRTAHSLAEPRPRAFEEPSSRLIAAEFLGVQHPFMKQLAPPRGDGVGLPVGEYGTRRGLQSCFGPTSMMIAAFFHGETLLTAHSDAGSAALRSGSTLEDLAPVRQLLLARSLVEERELVRIEDQPAPTISCCCCTNSSGMHIGSVCADANGTVSIVALRSPFRLLTPRRKQSNPEGTKRRRRRWSS